jgi:hypothetical protein
MTGIYFEMLQPLDYFTKNRIVTEHPKSKLIDVVKATISQVF